MHFSGFLDLARHVDPEGTREFVRWALADDLATNAIRKSRWIRRVVDGFRSAEDFRAWVAEVKARAAGS